MGRTDPGCKCLLHSVGDLQYDCLEHLPLHGGKRSIRVHTEFAWNVRVGAFPAVWVISA